MNDIAVDSMLRTAQALGMAAAEDPRARFRELPDHPSADELVETSDVSQAAPPEQEVAEMWRTTVFGPGG